MRSIPALVAICLAAGCQGQSHVANPVVGPPPPRIPGAPTDAAHVEMVGRGNLDEVVQVDAESDADGQFRPRVAEDGPLGPAGQVAARVNGTPIFTAEVLEPYANPLAEVHAQVPPEQFRRLQQQLLQRDLPQYIDQLLLYDAVMGQLEPEEREQIDVQIDEFFQLHLQRLMQEQNLQTFADFERHLRESGTSLESARRAFGRQEISMQYLRESINGNPPVSRTELLEEYRARHDELTQPARIRWQQIRISFDRHGSQARAESVLQSAHDELASGTPFEDVAVTYSDGPLASRGGEWDWTQLDSISDDHLRDALEELSVGAVSQPIEQEHAYLIVKLTGRRPAETTPFADVQDELRESIRNRKREAGIRAAIDQLKSKAVITTIFDDEQVES